MASGGLRGLTTGRPAFMNTLGANKPSWTNPSNSVQGAYGAAVNQQGGDYDKIMGRYDTLFNQAQEGRKTNSTINTPKVEATQRQYQNIPAYQRSEAMNNVMGQLQGFADTGGYSQDDINAFRSRGLSPIRSIYSTALNNLKRQRAIQGGYSPNFGAMQAKLAREQSGIIGQHTMDLNANIAERVAEGKKFGLSQLSPLASQEQSALDAISRANAEGMNRFTDLNASDANRANEFNANMFLETERLNRQADQQWMQDALSANQGAANLYGTTPALVNTFGNQVLQSNQQNLSGQQAEAQIRQQRANLGGQLVGMGAGRIPSYGGRSAGMGLG